MFILNDERHNTGRQAFLENNQPAHTSISILEGMYPFKMVMEVNDVLNCYFLLVMIGVNQLFHFCGHSRGQGGFCSTNHIGPQLVISGPEPGFP